MQLFYHFLGIIFVIVLIHFIFIDVKNIIHLKSINEASIHTENEHVLPSKINLRPKKVVTKLTAQDENSLMMLQINDTLSSLQSELQRLKRLKGEMKSRKQANQMIRTKTLDSTPPADSPKIVPKKKLNALIFTMDCITSYEQNSKSGGAAGELIIRHALEDAFREFQIPLRIIRSDNEFASCDMNQFDIILLDSWTWAAKGWVPKRNIVGHERKIYILDFFGSSKLRSDSLRINIEKQVLTAFKSPWNTFLGYYISEERMKLRTEKSNQGVVWGKDPKYYQGHEGMLSQVANKVHLKSTATQTLFQHHNFEWVGHQSSEEWLQLLSSSKFLLGLGHPLLGPSAVDAISLGCMFINPIYKMPQLEAKYRSQHPYVVDVAPDYVCSYEEDNVNSLMNCVDKALQSDLKPMIPTELTKAVYFERVRRIFNL